MHGGRPARQGRTTSGAFTYTPRRLIDGGECSSSTPASDRGAGDRRPVHRRPEGLSPAAPPPTAPRSGSGRAAGKVQREYGRVLKGFSAKLDAKALAEVRKRPAVDYVEPDRVITLDATQTNATWGLDRHRPARAAAQRHATATRPPARASRRTSSTPASASPTASSAAGPRPATTRSTAAAPTTATATARTSPARSAARPTASPRACALVAVRVLDCSGSGIDLGRHRRHRLGHRQPRGGRPAVANMSLGGGASTALDTAVDATRSPTASPTASRPATRTPNACNASPARVAERDHGRRDDDDRRARVVLELRHLRRHLRARARASRRPGTRRTRRPTRSAARRWRRRTSSARPRCYLQSNPGATPAAVASRDRRQRDRRAS